MELRLLRYFSMVADVGNVTHAAARLHITQPTLSRQIAQLEAELGVPLFERRGKCLSLTPEGMLLRRRAAEILELADRAKRELGEKTHGLEGTIAVGCGDLHAMELLARLAGEFSDANPLVTFDVFCATADVVSERMEAGLADFGLLAEPVDVARYEYVRTGVPERWAVAMSVNDPLASLEVITPRDLVKRRLLLPRRQVVRSVIDHWFDGAGVTPAHVSTANLSFGAAMLCKCGGWVALLMEGSTGNWADDNITLRPIEPPMEGTSVIAWRRGALLASASRAFVQFMRERLG